jgi:GWxTD domain-containing protein
MHRLCTLAVAAILVAASLAAADLGKFQEWDESPQGYFLTKEERAEWASITTEAEAEKFVADFLAKRDPGFTTEIAKRAEMADKHLTIGKTKGSKSLRGKVVILFGPPSGLSIQPRAKSNVKRDNPMVAGALSNAGSAASAGRDDSPANAGRNMSTATRIDSYSITYNGDAAMKTIGKPSVTFVIDAEAATGKDEFASRSAGKDAEKLFELAAQASIKK